MAALMAKFPKVRAHQRMILGGTTALVAGIAIAWRLLLGAQEPEVPLASQGGLVIERAVLDGRIDPARPLRCFVQGQFVGEFTLADCAQRNGVATGALDVGVDETGSLAAAQEAGIVLMPLPPQEAGPQVQSQAVKPASQPHAACWRYSGGQWRRFPTDMDMNACVQSLFAGHCERIGQATYGRWGEQTLRLVAGRVEISSDNQTFRTLLQQGPQCSLPPLG